MNARDTIQLVVEGKAPEGWATTRGVYANLSKWPQEVEYYVKCPKCGLVHGSFKSMREAHGKKLCDVCNLEQINKLKDEIKDVVDDPEHKPKEMAKFSESDEFDPFDSPPEHEGVPEPPNEDEPGDTKGEIDRLLMGNWVDVALRQFSDTEDHPLSDLSIDDRWSESEGNYDPSNLEDTTAFKLDVAAREYLVFKNDEEARNYALKYVRNDLENEPEIFTQDWLKDFVNEERLKEAIGDPNEEWEDDVRGLYYEDLLDKMVEEGRIDDDDAVFFKKDGDKRVENKQRAKLLNGYLEDYITDEKPKPPDPWDWLTDIYGKEEATKKAIEMAGIDVDKAAESAVDTDGVAHFVARYDGHEHTLENGAHYYRTN